MREVFSAAIVGPSDSGKTTLITRLVTHFAGQGLRVAVIKHDGHAQPDELPEWQKPEADTALALTAGAAAVMVVGGGQSLVQWRDDVDAGDPLRLRDRLIAQAGLLREPLAGVLFEGFSGAGLPKLVLARTPEQVAFVRKRTFTNVLGFVLSPAVAALADPLWRVYHEDNIAQMIDAIRTNRG